MNLACDPSSDQSAPSTAKVALVVDLDGTLCRSDTLHESIIALILRRPVMILRLLAWLRGGKAAFKRRLADHMIADPALLPYDEAVLQMVGQARLDGRPTALVSAAEQRQVQAVADFLGDFDLAVGTNAASGPNADIGGPADTAAAQGDADPVNLSGQNKADYLCARYGVGGFDYLGDARVDIPVWKAARRAYGVGVSRATSRKAAAQGISLIAAGRQNEAVWRALIRACRPHQWAKNILIILPVLAAQQPAGLPAAMLAMLSFSLAASAIYIVNDLADLRSDRLHPRKRHRPFAAGLARPRDGMMLSACLLAAAIALAAVLPAAFLAALLVYVALTSAYSFWLKRKMMVDVITLATLYTLRIVAGSMATGIGLSPWLLVFSMFLFFALATIKRQAELEDMLGRGVVTTSGRNMLPADLPILQAMSVGASQSAVLVFALYTQDAEVQDHFSRPDLLLLICPLLFLWLGRMQLITRRGFMTDDPIVFTFRDMLGLICGLLIALIFTAAAL